VIRPSHWILNVNELQSQYPFFPQSPQAPFYTPEDSRTITLAAWNQNAKCCMKNRLSKPPRLVSPTFQPLMWRPGALSAPSLANSSTTAFHSGCASSRGDSWPHADAGTTQDTPASRIGIGDADGKARSPAAPGRCPPHNKIGRTRNPPRLAFAGLHTPEAESCR